MITVRIGGYRPNATATTMTGVSGVTFMATGDTDPGDTGTCTTTAADPTTCTISIPDATMTQTYTVTPTDTPRNWFANPGLGVYPGVTPPSDNPPTTYDTVTTRDLAPGGSTTVPVASDTIDPTSRESQIAFSRTDTLEPTRCGLRVALLFDLSTSIVSPTNHLDVYRAAGESFVDTLEGTPSSIAVYTFGTNAPATSSATADNTALPPTAVSTPAGADTVRDKIGQLNVVGAQYTNWDAGLWQIANSGDHYDVVIVLTDGDPTRYGRPDAKGIPTAYGVRTRFLDVENGIFSANTLKTTAGTSVAHPAVLAVGINVPSPGSQANLRSISGRNDYYSTNFEDLESQLNSLAGVQCEGSISVVKRIVPPGGSIADATNGGAGWSFTSTVPDETRTTDDTSAVSFETEDDTPTTITAHERSGYTFLSDDTRCENTVTGDTVDIGRHPDGFTVTPELDGIISCTVYNRAPLPVPSIRITKTAFPTEFGVAGERIEYTFAVKNDGKTTLHDITVHDNMLGHIECPKTTLEPDEEMTCEFIHYTNDDDVARGYIHNVVTVTGRSPENEEVKDEDSATVTEIHGPGIQIEKTPFPTRYAVAGERTTYTYRVVNVGTVALHDITLTDSRLGRITCPSTVLDPGREMDCTATHIVTEADLAAGHIHNVAVVTGLDPDGREVTDDDDATVTVLHGPGLAIEKSASPGTFTGAGQKITYTYRVVNVGNVSVHGISVIDTKAGTVTNCVSTTLHPGESTTCTATYTTTATDVARGYIPNFAFARGYKPDGSPITSPEAEAIVTLPEVPVTG